MAQATLGDAVVDNPPVKAKKPPKVISYDEFCSRMVTAALAHNITMITNRDEGEASGALSGLLMKCYRVYLNALKNGWEAYGE